MGLKLKLQMFATADGSENHPKSTIDAVVVSCNKKIAKFILSNKEEYR